MSHKSVFQLFETLQFEHEVCLLRAKIYPVVKHKEYWRGLAQKKKEKILDIAKRNNLPCIFDNNLIANSIRDKVYKDTGMPNFYYPDFQKQEQQKYWDTVNYFQKGVEIKYYENGHPQVSILQSICLSTQKVTLCNDKKQVVTISFDNCSRIL